MEEDTLSICTSLLSIGWKGVSLRLRHEMVAKKITPVVIERDALEYHDVPYELGLL